MFGFQRHAKQEIFRYWDGTRMRGADPLLVFRTMIAHPTFDLEKHTELMRVPDVKVQMEAVQITVDAVREILGVNAWSEAGGGGLADREVLALLDQFIIYTANLKKNGSGQQTWPDATVSPSLGDKPEITKPSSASGSTSTGNIYETQPAS